MNILRALYPSLSYPCATCILYHGNTCCARIILGNRVNLGSALERQTTRWVSECSDWLTDCAWILKSIFGGFSLNSVVDIILPWPSSILRIIWSECHKNVVAFALFCGSRNFGPPNSNGGGGGFILFSAIFSLVHELLADHVNEGRKHINNGFILIYCLAVGLLVLLLAIIPPLPWLTELSHPHIKLWIPTSSSSLGRF